MIKIKLRKRTWVVLVAAMLVVGLAGAYVGARILLERRVARWGEQGIAASKAGDHALAVDLLVRYLQRHPDDPQKAMDYYITSREAAELPNGQHLAETVAAIKILLGKHPDRVDQRLHLLELYAKLEQRPE